MSGEIMTFPNTWEEYEKYWGFNDSEEVYTNNARLIPSFRVKQWLDHIKEAEPKWIPVSERFPEERGRYLCYIVDNVENGKSIMTCEWYPDIRDYWFPDDEDAVGDVTAWMPLPEPYEEKKKCTDSKEEMK